MPRKRTEKTPPTEVDAWEFFREIGLDRKALPPYESAEEFARSLVREFTRPTRWLISQSGSSSSETRPA